MAYDIGPKIGIEGEAEYRKQIHTINQQMRTLNSEMQMVRSAFQDNEQSIESYTAQNEVLNKQIDTQKKRLQMLQDMLQKSTEKFGANAEETLRWQQAVNRATTELNNLEATLRRNNAAIDELTNSSDEATDATDSLSESIDDAAENSDKLGNAFGAVSVAAGNLVSKGIELAISAIADMVSAIWNLDEATEEYRIAQGKLQTAFEATGYSAETAQQTYTEFFKILGDTDTATEASQLLAQLADSEEDLTEWTNIAAGVYGTFGDSLPIEGLIEAANETIKVGQVTGTLADALNWVGISEDEFNEKLAACTSESERNDLVMRTLSQTYDEASEAFYRNNESIIAAREAQSSLDSVLASLGGTISNLKTNIAGELLPSVANIAEAFNGIITGAEGADEELSTAINGLIDKVTSMLPQFIEKGTQIVSSLLSGIAQSLPTIIQGGAELLTTFAQSIVDNLPTILDMGLQLVVGLTKGILQAIPTMLEALPEIISSFTDYIIGSRDQIAEAGAELFMALVDNLPDIILAIGDSTFEIIEAILIALGGAVGDIIGLGEEWGKNLMSGFIDGIVSMFSKLANAGKQAISAIGDFIGFNSPSKKGEGRYIIDWGRNMIDGFLQGAEEAMPDVSAMAGNITSTMGAGLSSDNSGTTAGGGTINITVNVGSVRNNNDIKAISRELNRSIKGYERALGVT